VHTRLGMSRFSSQTARELHKRVFWCLVYIGTLELWCVGSRQLLNPCRLRSCYLCRHGQDAEHE
jgi:hypothetical protein